MSVQNAMRTIKAECEACGGSGLYACFVEHHQAYIICGHCNGSGFRKLQYKPFKMRRIMPNVELVRLENGEWISYQDFLKRR